MNVKLFIFRIFGLPIIAALAVAFGGIQASIFGAALLAFPVALLFTAVSERLFRQKLMGKIGKDPIAWYFMHLVYESALIALLFWGAFAIFGWSAAGWGAIIGGAAAWILLTWDTLGSLLPLIPLWLATRR